MGFLKDIAAKGLGSVIGDDLADALIPDDLGRRVAKQAAKSAGEEAVDAAVGAAVSASINSLSNRKKDSLATPPPPPAVPNMKKSIRVMVAVNGQQYGPYEEAGLRNMINEGSLTRDTYVFIEGASEWKFAKDVPQVNALFGNPAIPAPPAPFAPAPPVPGNDSASSRSDIGRDGLGAKLSSLIDAAVADGEISDLERQVLIRNAQSEGVAMDEFVVILEARLFEQRKRLQAERETLNYQKKQADASSLHVANTQHAEKRHDVRKCPACGSVIMSANDDRCQECGYEFASASLSVASKNTIEDLMSRLDKEDQEYQKRSGGNGLFSQSINMLFNEQKLVQKKATIIAAYILPSGRHDLAAFISACKSCADNYPMGDFTGKAWRKKFKEALEEYTRRYSGDPEAMAVVAKYSEKKKKFGLF